LHSIRDVISLRGVHITAERSRSFQSPNMSSSQTRPYVRLAKPGEYAEVANILTRAFARDPAMNWYGCVKKMVPSYKDTSDYNTYPAHAKHTLKNLHIFQSAILRATIISGGLVTVAMIPKPNGEGATEETIAGATLWLKPGQTLDFPIATVIRSGVWRVLFAFGLAGVKRVLLEFSPAVEKSVQKAFKSRNLDRLDSWHLLEMVVDPPYEGKGFGSLMIADGFKRTSPKPIHLEATTPRTQAMYSHWGFEVDEKHQFGQAEVDNDGLYATGDAATGYPEWIMTKWET